MARQKGRQVKQVILLTCAWVLWSQSVFQGAALEIVGNWGTLSAHPSYQECMATREFAIKEAKPPLPSFTFIFLCLPDTVDPRQPKK